MAKQQININKYISEIKRTLNIKATDEIIEKDLILTLLLAEFENHHLNDELIFKGGTLLARNYLNYHRFSEDLDFVHKDSNKLRLLNRSAREKRIKKFIDSFIKKLKEISDSLELDFNTDRSNTKYCRIMHARSVYTFKLYYSGSNYIKVEINFIEELINKPVETTIKTITDYFDSKELLFTLGLKVKNFTVLSYPLKEIISEKYRALITRKELKERDLFDLYLIKESLKPDIKQVVTKIINSSLITRGLKELIKRKLNELEKGTFFNSTEKIENLAITNYDKEEFNQFKQKIKNILIQICNETIKEL